MHIRTFVQDDLEQLTALTIETFRPFYEDHFRPLVGEVVFTNQHGNWRADYRTMVAELHNPGQHKHMAVAEIGNAMAGYIAWSADPARRNGTIVIIAVATEYRRHHTGTTLCEHAFAQLRTQGADVVEIGTGGDPFHAPARALYGKLGCTQLPTAVYYRQL